MPNMSLSKLPAREQDPNIRNCNFEEVSQGYDEAMAIEEATRCLNCKHMPCVAGCPVNVRIPEFIQLVIQGKFMEANDVIRSTNALPAVCGQRLPAGDPVRGEVRARHQGRPCRHRTAGALCRGLCDDARHGYACSPCRTMAKKSPSSAAAPRGLTCAGDLRKLGYEVTIFEALHTPGGVLVYGIPEFRLPKQLVRDEIKILEDMGVKIETNMVVGRSITLDELLNEEGYSAVFVGSGAGLPRFQGIPGENLNGVYSANEFLTRINLMKAYHFPGIGHARAGGQKRGGGRRRKRRDGRGEKRKAVGRGECLYRLPPRRGGDARARRRSAPRQGRGHHLQDADQSRRRYLGDENGYVKAMTCVEMELGEPDASGRRRPVVKAGSEHTIDVDTVVIAIGNSPNPLIKNTTPGLATEKWGGIIVDEATGKTSRDHVYAGGDTVTGAATVILAMGAGKTAAKAIHDELNGNSTCQ